jgi:hypothetical protein
MSCHGIPTDLLGAIQAETALYGGRGSETGLFLLAPPDAVDISHVAFAGVRGIARRRGLFTVSPKALAKLFRYAREHGLGVAAQGHSHEHGAFLSECDLRHGFAVEGFTSTVIPEFKAPSAEPADWGWWRYQRGRWQACDPYRTAPGAARAVLEFDEDGVRAR